MNKQANTLPVSAEFQAFVHNLSDLARAKERMPFIGRQRELEAVMETLLRKFKNNVILVGKPGVGKTALITELAHRINSGHVPPFLRHKTIIELSVNSFLYSSDSTEKLAKDFERFFAEIKQQKDQIILFLDEMQIQTIADPARKNQFSSIQGLLKTFIANRDVTVIGATNPEDYYKYIKTDEVLSANFFAILILEPEKGEMIEILKGVQKYFEKYYDIEIPVGLFDQVYVTAQRFIPHRAFPDKAIDLLDMACSKASVKNEKKLSAEYLCQSASDISRLPSSIIQKNPEKHYRGIHDYLKQTVVDQREALEEISRIVKIAKLDIDANQIRPEGIFLFLGPAGSGKSFVAARIAEYLFGSPEKLRTIDLAGFQKGEDINKLIAGEDEIGSGILVKEIENHPFAVILFENIELAHSSVLYFLGKSLSKGLIVDHYGKRHYVSNIIFILSLTSIGEERKASSIGFVKKSQSQPEIVVAPKIMNVLDWVDEIIEFKPLTSEHLRKIAQENLVKMTRDLQKRYRCSVKIAAPVLDLISSTALQSGRFAHSVSDLIEREVKMKIMDTITRKSGPLELLVQVKNHRIAVEYC